MASQNRTWGSSKTEPISVDSDSDDNVPITRPIAASRPTATAPTATAGAGSSSSQIPKPGPGPGVGLTVPVVQTGSRSRSHISIGSSANSSRGSPESESSTRAEKRPKPSSSSSRQGSERRSEERRSSKATGRKSLVLPGQWDEILERPRSRSQVQRERNRQVIELLDSDDEVPPVPAAGSSTSPTTSQRPKPTPSPAKPRIPPTPSSSSKPANHAPHAESSIARPPSDAASSDSDSLTFFPSNHAHGSSSRPSAAVEVPSASQSSLPATARKRSAPNSAMKKRMTMADKPHISLSPDAPDIPRPPNLLPGQRPTGASAAAGSSGAGPGPSSSGPAGSSRAKILEAENGMDEYTPAGDNGEVTSFAFFDPVSGTHIQRPIQAQSTTSRQPKRPPSPSSPEVGRPPRSKSGPGAPRRRILPPSSPASSISSVPVAGPATTAYAGYQSSNVSRNGVTEPTFFPQPDRAGPSTVAPSRNTVTSSVALANGSDSGFNRPSPSTPGAEPRSDDPLDSIPRAGPSQYNSRRPNHTPSPSSDDIMLHDVDYAEIDTEPGIVVSGRAPTLELHEQEQTHAHKSKRPAAPVAQDLSDDSDVLLPPIPDGDGNISMLSSPMLRPADLTAAQVERALVDATHGVDDIDIVDADAEVEASSPAAVEVPLPARPELGEAAKRARDKFASMTRAQKLAYIDRDGSETDSDKNADREKANGRAKRRTGRKGSQRFSDRDGSSSVDKVELTISNSWDIKPKSKSKSKPSCSQSIPVPSHPSSELDEPLDGPSSSGVPGPEHPPPEYRGTVRRYFESDTIDDYNLLKPTLTHNPALHRKMFQDWMSTCSAGAEPYAKEIGVVNTTEEGGGAAPEMEYQYGNDMMYHPDVPDPDTGMGCGCVGPCNPNDQSCRCVRRQELYFYATMLTGFAYHEDGTVKNLSVPVWECGPNCGCPPSCMNRVIQRGRGESTELDLFKTKNKGWGVRARYAIPVGTFLGVYSGELIPDYESERRGHLYNQIGRTYLFDCDGWQIRNPPDLKQLRVVDPRLADLAEQSVRRFKAVAERAGEEEMDYYSAYSVDAFHYGFTRYFNHSCDPNLAITQAYVGDYHPERPKLVMFTQRPIAAGDEMCISYMGIPDDDEPPIPRPVPVAKPARRNTKSGRRQKNKTSATAHVAAVAKPDDTKSTCRCGAKNCKGTMFAIESREDE